MNIFAGSRRIATVAAALWIVGWLIAAAAHETKVSARYDFIVGSNFANFAGFDLYSCSQNTYDRSLNIKTESGRPIQITLCIAGTSINVPQGFILDDPTLLLKDPSYINAPLDKKQKLFNTHVAPSSDYSSANLATRNAIREKFGVPGIQEWEKAPFDPDAYLANKKAEAELSARLRLAELEAKAAGKTPPLVSNEVEFKISKQEEERLNKKWWESWRSAYGQGLAIMIGGLATLLIFSLSTGWIVRGFMGIPTGHDQKDSP